MYRKIVEKSGKNGFWKFKFNVNQNEKRKQKRNGWSNLRGALRAPLAGSPTCVFVFVFVLIYVEFEFSPPPTPQPRFQGVKQKTKNHEKYEVWLKWKFRSWRSILSRNHQNWRYLRVFLAILKFGKNRKKLYREQNCFQAVPNDLKFVLRQV